MMRELWKGVMDPAVYADREDMVEAALAAVRRQLGRDGLRVDGQLEAWTTDAGYPGSALVQVHVGYREG